MASTFEGTHLHGGADFYLHLHDGGHDGNSKPSPKGHRLNGEDDSMLNGM